MSGVAAMSEALTAGLKCVLLEAAEPLSTIKNFPKGKPIYTYPTDMEPAGDLQFGESASVKEGLVGDLESFMAERGIEPRIAPRSGRGGWWRLVPRGLAWPRLRLVRELQRAYARMRLADADRVAARRSGALWTSCEP